MKTRMTQTWIVHYTYGNDGMEMGEARVVSDTLELALPLAIVHIKDIGRTLNKLYKIEIMNDHTVVEVDDAPIRIMKCSRKHVEEVPL